MGKAKKTLGDIGGKIQSAGGSYQLAGIREVANRTGIGDTFDSITGKTAAKNRASKMSGEAQQRAEERAKVEAAANVLQSQRTALEGQRGTFTPVQAQLVNRGDVRQVGAQTGMQGTSTDIDRAGIRNVVAEGGAQGVAERMNRADVANVAALTGARTSAADINQLPQSEFRARQQSLADALTAQMMGTGGPSLAQLQLKGATDRNLAQALALRAGTQGPNAALSRRDVMRQQGDVAQQMAAQGAELRAKEVATAQGLLGGLVTDVRGQDIGLATQQAQLQQQTNLANLEAAKADQERVFKADAINQSADLDILKQNAAAGNQMAIANLAARQADQDRQLKANLANQGVDLAVLQANAAAANNMSLANLQAQMADADRALRADLANQGVDLDVVKQNATMGNQVALANLQAQLTKMGLDDNMIQSYLAAETGLLTGNQNALIAQQQMLGQQRAAQDAAKSSMMGGLMSAGGAIGAAAIAASDENLKTNITSVMPGESKGKKQLEDEDKKKKESLANLIKGLTSAGETKDVGEGIRNVGSSIASAITANATKSAPATSDKDMKKDISTSKSQLDDFYKALKAYEYDYKNPERDGEGKQVSVMAQDLEKSEIGKKAIIEAPHGKMVDYSKLLPIMLAGSVEQRQRISNLEEALKKRSTKKESK